MHPIPRRCYIDKMAPAELAIRDALLSVEALGAAVRLTDAVTLLAQAQARVADWVDNTSSRALPGLPDRPAQRDSREPESGWLEGQLEEAAREVASWPEWKREHLRRQVRYADDSGRDNTSHGNY